MYDCFFSPRYMKVIKSLPCMSSDISRNSTLSTEICSPFTITQEISSGIQLQMSSSMSQNYSKYSNTQEKYQCKTKYYYFQCKTKYFQCKTKYYLDKNFVDKGYFGCYLGGMEKHFVIKSNVRQCLTMYYNFI